MMKSILVLSLFAFVSAGEAGAKQQHFAAAEDILKAPPPSPFEPFSVLSGLTNNQLPGLGNLYVQLTEAPTIGPYLGYDDDALVNITYMIPLKQGILEKNSFFPLGSELGDITIDHTDIYYVKGHPGFPEEHYHIVNWLIPHDVHVEQFGLLESINEHF